MTDKNMPILAASPTLTATDIILTRPTGATEDTKSTLSQVSTLLRTLLYSVVGSGIQIKEGTNARMGTVTLASGTATVTNNTVTANTRIFLTVQSLGTVTLPKAVGVSARTAATNFTILSSDLTDTSVIAWELHEPSP